MKGRKFGSLGNMIVGVIGALLGGFLFGLGGITAGSDLAGSLNTALVGAVLVLFIIGLSKTSSAE